MGSRAAGQRRRWTGVQCLPPMCPVSASMCPVFTRMCPLFGLMCPVCGRMCSVGVDDAWAPGASARRSWGGFGVEVGRGTQRAGGRRWLWRRATTREQGVFTVLAAMCSVFARMCSVSGPMCSVSAPFPPRCVHFPGRCVHPGLTTRFSLARRHRRPDPATSDRGTPQAAVCFASSRGLRHI